MTLYRINCADLSHDLMKLRGIFNSQQIRSL